MGAMGCVAFHIGFLKKESACCESLSHASGVPAPFNKGAFLRPVSLLQRKRLPFLGAFLWFYP